MKLINRKNPTCDNCVGNKYPIGDYCEGCGFKEYRRKKDNG